MRLIVSLLAALAAFFLAVNRPADAQTKRIKDLPAATSTVTGDIVPIDGTTLRGITVESFLKPSLIAIRALTPAVDKCIIFTSATAAALADCPAYGLSLLATASSSAARTALGLVISTDVQPFDADLTAIAGVSTTGIVRRTGSATFTAANSVTNAELATVGAYTLKMNATGSTAAPTDTKISGLTSTGGFGAGDKLLIEESTGELRKIDFSDLPGAAGTTAASQAEQEAGSTTANFTTPGRQQFHPSAAKAWARCTAAGALSEGYNISGGTCGRSGTGEYVLTFTTAFSTSTFPCFVTLQSTNLTAGAGPGSTSTATVSVRNLSSAATDSIFQIVCFGDQ